MEETAASAQEMTNTSSEIETASRTIAEKSRKLLLRLLRSVNVLPIPGLMLRQPRQRLM